MATTNISSSTTPLHFTPLKSKPATEEDLLAHLTTFLTSRTDIQPDIVYQLTELHKNVQWQVDGKVSSLEITKGSGPLAETEEVAAPKKKKAKKGGSKWA